LKDPWCPQVAAAHSSRSIHPSSGVIIQPCLHLHEHSLLLPSFSFNCSCCLVFLSFWFVYSFFQQVFSVLCLSFTFCSVQFASFPILFGGFKFYLFLLVQFDNNWIFYMSLCFGTSFGEFLFIEPSSISMIKCLALNQLKMNPKNVKNHSNCASGITSKVLLQ